MEENNNNLFGPSREMAEVIKGEFPKINISKPKKISFDQKTRENFINNQTPDQTLINTQQNEIC